MAEKSDADRISELEAKIAQLERERASAPDLEWLRNSHTWRRTEYWANPKWHWVGAAGTLFMIALFAFGNWMADLKDRPGLDEPLEPGQERHTVMPDGSIKITYGPAIKDQKSSKTQ